MHAPLVLTEYCDQFGAQNKRIAMHAGVQITTLYQTCSYASADAGKHTMRTSATSTKMVTTQASHFSNAKHTILSPFGGENGVFRGKY